MQHSFVSLFFLFAAPAAVFACEGECIVGITNAFLGKFSHIVQNISKDVETHIIAQLIPHQSRPTTKLVYLSPLTDAYATTSYDPLRSAIFPGYFHGKCQVNGVDPKGCPNPDCPVVCGTPGSLVHFYPKLRAIAFNNTREMLTNLSNPKGVVFGKILDRVMKDAEKHTPRMIKVYGRAPADVPTSDMASAAQHHSSYPNTIFSFTKRGQAVRKQLEQVMSKMVPSLEQACGSTGDDGLEGLKMCSWEKEMKQLILSYP